MADATERMARAVYESLHTNVTPWRKLTDEDRLRYMLAVEAALAAGRCRMEFIVCNAAGYPDPHAPWPNTLETARGFVREHTTAEFPQPEIKRRVVSGWEEVT